MDGLSAAWKRAARVRTFTRSITTWPFSHHHSHPLSSRSSCGQPRTKSLIWPAVASVAHRIQPSRKSSLFSQIIATSSHQTPLYAFFSPTGGTEWVRKSRSSRPSPRVDRRICAPQAPYRSFLAGRTMGQSSAASSGIVPCRRRTSWKRQSPCPWTVSSTCTHVYIKVRFVILPCADPKPTDNCCSVLRTWGRKYRPPSLDSIEPRSNIDLAICLMQSSSSLSIQRATKTLPAERWNSPPKKTWLQQTATQKLKQTFSLFPCRPHQAHPNHRDCIGQDENFCFSSRTRAKGQCSTLIASSLAVDWTCLFIFSAECFSFLASFVRRKTVQKPSKRNISLDTSSSESCF